MAKLEFARKMTTAEWQSVVSYRNSQYDKKKDTAKQILEDNFKILIDEYNDLEKRYLLISSNTRAEYHKADKIKASKKCICGADIKWNIKHHFWGCVDYKNEAVSHKNFEGKDVFIWEEPILKNYLTAIIYKYGLKGKLTSKSLFQFYTDNNLPDLQEKYTDGSSVDLINRYQNVKAIATDFENKTEKFLRDIYPVVNSQFKVMYKYEGDIQRHCILDFLCSNNEEVVIYECKTNKWDKDELQKSLYIDVISKMIATLSIKKSLKFQFVFQNEESGCVS